MSRVVVAGSVNMDVSARVRQQPRPGETVFGSELLFTPGGKGSNQAVAASRLIGATQSDPAVCFIGKIGADAFGRELRAFLEQESLDLSGLHESKHQASGTALISVDEAGENQIIVIPGSNAELTAEEAMAARLAPGDIAVAVFEIPQETIVAFFRSARERGARTLLNPAPFAPFHPELPGLCDVLLLNEGELAGLAGLTEAPRAEKPCWKMMRAVRQFPEQTLIVTRGEKGALALGAGGCWRVPGHAVPAVDTTGAGDCFVGAFAAASARGETLAEALAFANVAAAFSVTRPGASQSMPRWQEISERLHRSQEPLPVERIS
ncbi:MAG: ribokinase [Anaerolineaceae bacterium]|nr:ribokinase [Anaerolineaceae bacterium]